MLNYIWAALIVLSFGFALWADVSDATSDRFRNGEPVPVTFAPSVEGEELEAALEANEVPVTVSMSSSAMAEHYPVFADEVVDDVSVSGVLIVTDEGAEVRMAESTSTDMVVEHDDSVLKVKVPTHRDLPAPWAEMDGFFREHHDADFFRAELVSSGDQHSEADGITAAGWLEPGTAFLKFDPVRLRKIKDIEAAAFWWAEWSIMFAIKLVGILCLWLGLVKIAEDAGLVLALVKLVRPMLGLVFPEIPKDHPALGMIALNLSANVLGLGNAATPMGIKAMEELQKLNPTDDTATNSMCMFLAINTASVMLVPPATLVAIMGVSTGQLWIPILVVTGMSLLIAISAAKALSLVPVYAKSDPMKQAPKATPAEASAEGGDA